MAKPDSKDISSSLDEMIDDYLFDRLSPKQRETFEVLCFNDTSLFEELRFREMVLAALRQAKEVALGDERQAKPTMPKSRAPWLGSAVAQSRRLAYFAAAAITIAILGTVLFRVVNNDAARKERDRLQQLYLANAEPIQSLEFNLGATSRSSYSIEVISPKSGQNFEEPDIPFQWQINFTGQLYLVIVSKQTEQKRFAIPVGANQFRLRKQLQPGMYYWKLETDDEALYIGKFFVKKQSE